MEADKKRVAAAELKKDITVGEVLQKYLITRKKLKPGAKDSYQKDFDRYLADWRDRPIRSLTGDEIIQRHADIGIRSPARADGTMRLLRALCNYTITMYTGILLQNPVRKLSAVKGWYNVKRKESYIQPGMLKVWLPAVLELSWDTTKDFILFMLFQGARKTETGTLRWKDVNLTTGTARIRETKTGVALEVPLSRYILDRLERRMAYYYDGPESYVFPSYGKSGYISDVRSALKQVAEKTGVQVSHHDLRRSFISYCSELEIDLFSRKRLVNHAVPQDVTEGYTIHSMVKLRELVERMAAFILGHAGIEYHHAEPALSPEQAGQIAGTEFWQTLTEEQRQAFLQILDTKKPPQGDKVISLEAEKIKRRVVVKR